jgi:hypothetical protein
MLEMAGSWLSLYPRQLLAEDATVADDGHGFAGIVLAHNVKSKAASRSARTAYPMHRAVHGVLDECRRAPARPPDRYGLGALVSAGVGWPVGGWPGFAPDCEGSLPFGGGKPQLACRHTVMVWT